MDMDVAVAFSFFLYFSVYYYYIVPFIRGCNGERVY